MINRNRNNKKEQSQKDQEEFSPEIAQSETNPDKYSQQDDSILGKRPILSMIMMQNIHATHNTQRRRDIKQNYKAKLPLDKLILEHEKKKAQVKELMEKRTGLVHRIRELWDRIGQKQGVNLDFDEKEFSAPPVDQTAELLQKTQQNSNKTHWDFLLKEAEWMADDFEKERKKKQGDAKKMVKNCKRSLHEKQILQEKMIREQKIELKRKSKFMSNIVQMYWKSCEKIVKHNYNVEYEKKRQAMRTKKLESFVSKHLKLSVKVAEQLNTKQFVEQSMMKPSLAEENEPVEEGVLKVDDGQKQIKIYDSQDQIEMKHLEEEEPEEDKAFAEQTVAMQNFQPTGHTLDQAKVSTQVPFLLKGSLREYQIIGLDWLVTLHNRKLNGILADEMGLGKTIQTISMLASLACDKGIWGPHLIVVPTTIIMNWEMEFKRWCPGFKILTYFGSQKERKIKRHGWSKDNSFHICITSYKLVIQDHFAFRRKKWYYMILDEAQNIKNFKSQRWQTMLRFNTKRRLLLTGTPLQNDVMELWSLMHFLMPNIFSNQQDFKEWFSNPFSQSINQNKSLNLRVVQKLQSILRPFLLRRMKRDVEKQLPEKIEHIIQCNLSRRQRLLYDEYINHDKTRNILADSDFFSIMSVLMQLRKVCNHPDLFEARSIESPFILTDQDRIRYPFCSQLLKELNFNSDGVNLSNLNFKLIDMEGRSNQICKRQIELLPQNQLCEPFIENQHLIGSNQPLFNQNKFSQYYMTNRPFQDGLADAPKHHTNCNSLLASNSQQLRETIPCIMPFDQGSNYRMQYHKVPNYVNVACLPFSQQFFSMESYDLMRYSSYESGPFNPVDQYKSAIQGEEQKQMMVRLARKLALWHSIDKQNRLQILYGLPIYGYDLRNAIKIVQVCNDIFDNRQFKYSKDIYSLPTSIFNSFCPNKRQSMIMEEWPQQTDAEIELLNQQNLIIKEITGKTREAIRLKKEKKEHEERMRQPKKVQRRVEEEVELEDVFIDLIIDMKALSKEEEPEKDENTPNEDEEVKENPNIEVKEERTTKVVKQVRFFEEIITMEQYLKEQGQQDNIKKEETQDDQNIKEEETSPAPKNEPEEVLTVSYKNTDTLKKMIISPMERANLMEETVKNFKIIIPKVVAKTPEFVPSKIYVKHQKDQAYENFLHQKLMQHKNVNQSLKYSNILFFPHKNLIQYDCGKLQKLAQLLKTLYNKGSKVIIFTQMTKMLDIFEQFLNLHGYIYVRLDGSVKTENRQKLVDRFNYNKKIFCFISSTRCGGVGINLTGADCVIFYDTDWNPAMDKQAQDRCHRIGQTKTVHIYRLISVNTIEENIFKKSLQKRELGGLIIEGNFNQEFFSKVSVKDILADNNVFKPKKIDIFKDENIVFHEEGAEGRLIEEYQHPVDFEANEMDLEQHEKEVEREKKIEQYRRRFEEALIRIEDHDDVVAMQDAQKELRDNDEEDMNEFDNELIEGGAPKVEQEVKKVNDGIGLTQGDIKKNEEIDWHANQNLNGVTKRCLDFTKEQYCFEEYLDERAKKDSKFVNIIEENNQAEDKNDQASDFSMSEDQEDTQISSAQKKEPWVRNQALDFYRETLQLIEQRLVQKN